MICPNCGAQNIDGSNFCIKCGKPIENTNPVINNNENVFNSTAPVEPTGMQSKVQNTVQHQTGVPNTEAVVEQHQTTPTVTVPDTGSIGATQHTSTTNAFVSMFKVIKKPFTAMKEELPKFNNIKKSAVLAIIVTLIATIASLIQTMFNSVRVVDYNFFSGKSTTTWVWDNLKDIEYIKVIGQNLLLFLGIIVAIAFVYYIGSLIIKKQPNFGRMLGIAAMGIVPLYISALILAPILNLIWTPLGMVVTVMGGVYSLLMIYETMNDEVALEGNVKYYFNLVCLSILLTSVYYVYIEFMLSPITDELGGILDYFG